MFAIGVLGLVYALTSGQIDVPAAAKTTPDGIRYVVIQERSDTVHPTPADDVTVSSLGWWLSGEPINSPDLRGTPYTYHLRPHQRLASGIVRGLALAARLILQRFPFFTPMTLRKHERRQLMPAKDAR